MAILIDHDNVGLAESDHRMANNLASLSGAVRLQRAAISRGGKTLTAEEVCLLLDDISARIEVTAKLHKSLALAANGDGVHLGNFVREIAEMICSLCPTGRAELIFDCSSEGHIEPRDALHAGLITAELLTNAVKYAHPTGVTVNIQVRCETGRDGSFAVEVIDDGMGLPENFDPSTDGGLGFQLMRALANGLHAELEFDHDSLGVRARLVRPGRLAS